MAGFNCPYCGEGKMVLETAPDHVTQLGGVPVEVEDAQVSRCTQCGQTTVSAREIKRWRRLQQEQLQARGQIPTPEEVKRTRELLGLSVSDFASLLAVTRQTVHAWERPDAGGMQLGPAALLVSLLVGEVDGKSGSVYAQLLRTAIDRGQMRRATVSGLTRTSSS